MGRGVRGKGIEDGWGRGDGQVRGATQSVIEINTNPHMYKQVCLRRVGHLGDEGREDGLGWGKWPSQRSHAECY